MATGTVVDVVMPQMGVSVSEGTITRWMKQVGEHIEADETIVEISTDKVDTEVPSPASGIVREILANDGDTVPVNTRIAVIAVGDAGDADAPADTAPPAATDNAEETPATPATSQTMSSQPAPEPHAANGSNGEDDDDSGRTFISPVVARMLAEHRLDVNQITGSGRGGRVTKKDVQAFIDSGGAQAEPVIHDVPHFAPPAEEPPVVSQPAPPPAAPASPPPAAPAPAPAAAAPPPPAPATQQALVASGGDEELYQFNTIRKVIARHMRHSLDTAAHVTTVIEVDMTGVVNLRKKWKPEYQQRYGVNLTYIPFIARATIDAIGRWPWVNAEVQGESALIKKYVNLGMAVAIDDSKGLMVPVIHHAEEMNLVGPVAVGDRAGRQGPHQDAHARRDGRRHVHHHQPGRVRRADGHAHHPRGPGRDPRRGGDRQAAGGGQRPSRQRLDRDPPHDVPVPVLRPPPGGRRLRRASSWRRSRRTSRAGTSRRSGL